MGRDTSQTPTILRDNVRLYVDFRDAPFSQIDDYINQLKGLVRTVAAFTVLVQEYGRYFGMRTTCFRGGCLTGPAHSGAALHGFLAYLIKCVVTEIPYKVLGYKEKQVRDNIHASDLLDAFWEFFQRPGIGKVYNIGGGRHSNCSIIEAVSICERLTGREGKLSYEKENRVGDHIWWISDTRAFERDYPNWHQKYSLEATMKQICENAIERYKWPTRYST